MSNYLDKNDFLPYVRETHLDQIIENTPALLDQVETTAVTVVKDALHRLYDVDVIFAKTGANRDPQVVRWCITLALYYLYERISDIQTPERVKLNYELTLEMLGDVEGAKKSVLLPTKEGEDGEPKTKFRYGGQPPREHNIH